MCRNRIGKGVIRGMIGILLLAFIGLSGCEEQTKEAEERGKVPKQTLENAQKKVDDATAKMNERLNQLQTSPDE